MFQPVLKVKKHANCSGNSQNEQEGVASFIADWYPRDTNPFFSLMAHPHQSLLDEYKIAIAHFAPGVPEGVKAEAEAALATLSVNENAGEEEIWAAMEKTGLAEYPYRHALKDLASASADDRRKEIVLEHVDEAVRAKIAPLLESGVPIEEIVKSAMFETNFTGEERYQVEDALLDADHHLEEDLEHIPEKQAKGFEAKVKVWEKTRDLIQAKIDELESLKDKNAKWKDEIIETVKRLRTGFLVTEKDVELSEVEKEIEYWRGTLADEI